MKYAAVHCRTEGCGAAVTVGGRDDATVLTGECQSCHRIAEFTDPQTVPPPGGPQHSHVAYSAERDEPLPDEEPAEAEDDEDLDEDLERDETLQGAGGPLE